MLLLLELLLNPAGGNDSEKGGRENEQLSKSWAGVPILLAIGGSAMVRTAPQDHSSYLADKTAGAAAAAATATCCFSLTLLISPRPPMS